MPVIATQSEVQSIFTNSERFGGIDPSLLFASYKSPDRSVARSIFAKLTIYSRTSISAPSGLVYKVANVNGSCFEVGSHMLVEMLIGTSAHSE